MDNETSSQQQIAVRIAESATLTEREALKLWVRELLDIRGSDSQPLAKAKSAVAATARHKVVWPVMKVLAREIKRYGWDKRKGSSRLGIVGAGVGLTLLSGKAGVAALGGAVGVPLWIVLGAGGKFAGMLYSELVDKSAAETTVKTTYTVVEAEKEER